MDIQRHSRLFRFTTYVLFGLLIAAFALWGIGDLFRGASRASVVAQVAGQEIEAEQMARALRRAATQMQTEAGGGLTPEQLAAAGLAQRALQPLLQNAAFAQLADDMAIVVPDEVVLKAIQGQQAFRGPDGRFSQNAYFEALRRADLTEADYVALLRADIARDYLIGAFLAASKMPAAEANLLHAYLDEKRIAQYLIIGKDRFPDVGTPDETALEALYQARIDAFQAPEYRAVTLLQLRPEDFMGEVELSEAELRNRFEADKGDYVTPEQRRIDQLVFQDQAVATAALTALQGGKTLQQVAEENAIGSVISLGLLTQDQVAGLIPELAVAAFSLPAEQKFGSVKSLLGWHVFAVEEIVPGKDPSFEEVRASLEADAKMALAVESMASVAAQIDQELASGATLDETAARLQLPLRQLQAIDANGKDRAGTAVADLPSPRQFLAEVASADPGLDSELIEAEDGTFFAFRVDEVTPAAPRPLDEVREAAVALWQDEQRSERAQAEAARIADRLNAGESIEAIAAELALPIRATQAVTRFDTAPSLIPSPTLAARLFEVEPGTAVAVAADDGAVVALLRLVLAVDPAKDPERTTLVRSAFDQAWRGDLASQVLTGLQNAYPIEVYQEAIDQLVQSY